MRILVLPPAIYDTSPGQRFRIEQWMRYLERDGFEFTFVPFEDAQLHDVLYRRGHHVRKAALMFRALLRRVAAVTGARNYDVVFVPREASLIGPAVIERLVAILGVPLVYDFDDPIWIPYSSPTNGLFSKLKWPSKTAAICKLATRVIAGNRLLAEWARQHSQAVDVIPSTIDLNVYPMKGFQRGNGRLTLGWTGSHSTLPFLDILRGPLSRIAAQRPVRLKVISHTDQYDFDPGVIETVSRKWNAATEALDLHDIDVALGPFPSEGWTPWRCHGKVLQYMAAGIPCVVSNVGVLPDYIQDGVSGFVAQDQDEWIAKTLALLDDAELRQRMAREARATIERHYSAEMWAKRLKGILESAVDGVPAVPVVQSSPEYTPRD